MIDYVPAVNLQGSERNHGKSPSFRGVMSIHEQKMATFPLNEPKGSQGVEQAPTS